MKKLLLSLFVLSSIGLAACIGGGKKSDKSGSSEWDGKIEVIFYQDYNQIRIKEVYTSYRVENHTKLTKPADPTESNYPEFPVFIGWSRKEIVDNTEDLWDFENDTLDVKDNVKEFVLFGQWVAEGDL